jgi:hypothetical protein
MQARRNSYRSNIHEPPTQQIIDSGVNQEIKAISLIQSFHFSFQFCPGAFRSDMYGGVGVQNLPLNLDPGRQVFRMLCFTSFSFRREFRNF